MPAKIRPLTRKNLHGVWSELIIPWTDRDELDCRRFITAVRAYAGKTWNLLSVPASTYYPRSVQAANGQIFVFGHVGGDDPYGKVDQSMVMDSFRLVKP